MFVDDNFYCFQLVHSAYIMSNRKKFLPLLLAKYYLYLLMETVMSILLSLFDPNIASLINENFIAQ